MGKYLEDLLSHAPYAPTQQAEFRAWSKQFAHWLFGLFRTDPASQRHNGLSFVLVPLDTPGVSVRPIEKINGKVYRTGTP